jgi:hypothetical protein
MRATRASCVCVSPAGDFLRLAEEKPRMRCPRSFVRSALLRMQRARRRLPAGLDAFVLAGLRHGLAAA